MACSRVNFILLYFTLLYLALLYFTLLYLLYFTLLYFTLLYFTLLYFTLLHFTLLYAYLLHMCMNLAKRNENKDCTPVDQTHLPVRPLLLYFLALHAHLGLLIVYTWQGPLENDSRTSGRNLFLEY